MATDDMTYPAPWRLGLAVALFCLLMFGAGPVATALQLTGNAKLPLLIPGFAALLWMGWESRRYIRLTGNATPAMMRYMRRLIPLWIIYALLLIAAINLQRALAPQGALAVAIAILPALPLIGFIWAMGRLFVEESDEYQRMLHVRRALIATGFLLVVSTVWGFLESSGLAPHAPAWWAFILWNIGLIVAGILPWGRR
ncbi:hypothetical protein SAMN05518849_11396 [Sphingobium sp. AP50]|uniref:hypothetical protein n=1 Tax=Sphingobium sp. AP50 TaxID=1884369 RepID=UPI0008AC3423|nr:hypothetical protein [Sphingobium sp. AP50]SEJ77392.1 hypothetical protein SAMN05518849_11396 [Sphingobium sp. AP50]